MAHLNDSLPAASSRPPRQRTRPWSLALNLVLILALAYAVAPGLLHAGASVSHAASHVAAQASDLRPVPVHTATIRPLAGSVPLHWSKILPPRSAAEASAEQAALAQRRSLKAPTPSRTPTAPVGPAALSAPMPGPSKTGTPPRVSTGPRADTDLVYEQQNYANTAGNPAYQCTFGDCSADAQPSVADYGINMFLAYNWFLSSSTRGGADGSWYYVDPATQLSPYVNGAVFCCDQQVLYEPSRDMFVWEAEFSNGASASANPGGILLDPSLYNRNGSCAYYFTGASFYTLSNGDALVNPDIQFTTDNLFLTFDAYHAGIYEASIVARMSLTALDTCSAVGNVYFFQSGGGANYHYALTAGAQGTMWFVSDTYLSGGITGSKLNICAWQDGSTSNLQCVDRAIPAFNYLNSGKGNCASTDGLVVNWCYYLDSSVRNVFFTKANFRGFGPATLGVALTVGPAGSAPYPWVAVYYFEVAGLVYAAEDALYNTSLAYTTPAFAPNARGYLGWEITYGGGHPGYEFYPSEFFGIEDPTSPTPPWQAANYTSLANYYTVTDYNTVRPMYPSALAWIGASWWIDSTGNLHVGEIIWDRGRDHNAYVRSYLS